MDVRHRSGADPADGLPGVVAHGVQGVAAGLLQIGVHQALEDFGVGALAVVVAEAVHGMVPHFQNSKSNKNSCRNVTELMLKLYRISFINARRERPLYIFMKKEVLRAELFHPSVRHKDRQTQHKGVTTI